MNEFTVPEWMRPENLRWAAYQWENKVHFRRIGGTHAPFWCNTTYLDKYFDRLFCKKTLQEFRDLGITAIATSFNKGYGLEAEREEMNRQRHLVKMAHEIGLKVFGYINSNACYYETHFKERPGVIQRLIRDHLGQWRRPDVSYYPHKALLCVAYPEYLEYIKELSKLCIQDFEYDGIHFDMAYQGSCFCPECTKQFREYLEKHVKDETRLGFVGFDNVEIPCFLGVSEWDKKLGHVEMTVDPMLQEWIQFNAERFARIRLEIYEFIKQFGQDKGVILNNMCLSTFNGGDPTQLRNASDAFYIESNFPYALADGNIRTSIFNYKRVEAMGKIAIPTQWLMADGKVALPRTKKEITIGVLESAVYGGVPGNTWSSRSTGGSSLHLDQKNLSAHFREIIRFLDSHRMCYADSKSLPIISIVIPKPSFDYDRSSQLPHQALNTFCYTLQRANIPFRLVLEPDFNPLDRRMKMVILANVLAIGDNLGRRIKIFVERGGKLLLTGDSGDYNEYVLRREKNLFSDVLDLPNVRRLVPAPEMTSEKALYPEIWGPHITNYPEQWKKIIDEVKSLAEDYLPFSASAPDGLFIEARTNRHGDQSFHILNFKDTPQRFILSLKKGYNCPEIFSFPCNQEVMIKDNVIYGNCVDYLLLWFPHRS